MKSLLYFEKTHDIWNIKFNNIPVWSYLRANKRNQHLPYTPKFNFNYRDVKGFITFLSLFLKKEYVVIFIANRQDLKKYSLHVSSEMFQNNSPILFLRDETGKHGNVFVIEAFRFLLRKIGWLFSYSEYKAIIKKLIQADSELEDDKQLVKNLIGDYYFNTLLKVFLKNASAVLYSNAVIPRVERYSHLYASFELQHGVVHSTHLDYVHLPYINNTFICYSPKIMNSLFSWNFSGKVNVVEKPLERVNPIYKVILFGTVDRNHAKFIEDFCRYKSELNIDYKIKLHPKDQTRYSKLVLEKCIDNATPLDAEVPILPDTSLISECFLYNKSFLYIALDYSESDHIIKSYLLDKYNIYDNANTENIIIVRDLKDIMQYLGEAHET